MMYHATVVVTQEIQVEVEASDQYEAKERAKALAVTELASGIASVVAVEVLEVEKG